MRGALPGLLRAAAAAVAIALVATCARPPEPPAGLPPGGTPTPALTTPASPVPSGPGPAPGGDSRPCPTATGGEGGHAFLVAVRVGTHAGHDRITFELDPVRGGAPSYEAAGASPPFTKDPSDIPMEVEGQSFLRLVFHGATGVDLSGETYRLTYTGPEEIRPALPVLVEAEREGDFEATLSWVLGLSRPSCPRVSLLGSPLRIVVDLPH